MKVTGLQKPSALLILSAAAAVIVTRLFLLLAPNGGGSTILGFHVHHLLIGIVLIGIGGIPAALLRARPRLKSSSVAVFGFGLGLALDEWVLFVIRERVPDAPYMTPPSAVGAAIFVVLVIAYATVVDRFLNRKEERAGIETETTPPR